MPTTMRACPDATRSAAFRRSARRQLAGEQRRHELGRELRARASGRSIAHAARPAPRSGAMSADCPPDSAPPGASRGGRRGSCPSRPRPARAGSSASRPRGRPRSARRRRPGRACARTAERRRSARAARPVARAVADSARTNGALLQERGLQDERLVHAQRLRAPARSASSKLADGGCARSRCGHRAGRAAAGSSRGSGSGTVPSPSSTSSTIFVDLPAGDRGSSPDRSGSAGSRWPGRSSAPSPRRRRARSRGGRAAGCRGTPPPCRRRSPAGPARRSFIRQAWLKNVSDSSPWPSLITTSRSEPLRFCMRRSPTRRPRRRSSRARPPAATRSGSARRGGRSGADSAASRSPTVACRTPLERRRRLAAHRAVQARLEA